MQSEGSSLASPGDLALVGEDKEESMGGPEDDGGGGQFSFSP